MFHLTPFHKRETGIQRLPFGYLDIDALMENFFNDTVFPRLYSNSNLMKVDIRETAGEYIVEAELPGVKKEQISLDLSKNVLTISVQRKDEINEENERYIRKERRYGSMVRSFAVDNVIEDKATAKFENGILTITLPKIKHEEKKVNKINIQ